MKKISKLLFTAILSLSIGFGFSACNGTVRPTTQPTSNPSGTVAPSAPTSSPTQNNEPSPTATVPSEFFVSNESELLNAVENATSGKTVVLSSDITLTETLVLESDKNLTFDLGGKTLSSEQSIAMKLLRGNYTFKNGNLFCTQRVFNLDGVSGETESATELVLNLSDDLKVRSDTHICVFVLGSATLNTSCEMKSLGDFSTIQGNGNAVNNGSIINVLGGKIENDRSAAIYVPQYHTITVRDGLISGADAIYFKSGSMTVTGGQFVGIGEKRNYTYYGNGCVETGDAIVVDNCGYPGGDPIVTIAGGTFRSKNADAIGSYAYGTVGETARQPLKGFITGGSFSTNVNSLVADGFKVEERYTVRADANS